jgi:hypothetical protein
MYFTNLSPLLLIKSDFQLSPPQGLEEGITRPFSQNRAVGEKETYLFDQPSAFSTHERHVCMARLEVMNHFSKICSFPLKSVIVNNKIFVSS